MRSLIRDIVEAFGYMQTWEGWRPGLGSTVRFLLLPFLEYHRGFLLRRSLREPIVVPRPKADVTIRQATLDDLDLLETIVPALRGRRLAKKMQAGEVCCLAIQEQRAVAYVLGAFAHTPTTEDARLKLEPSEVYLWAAYALPEYRRQGVVGAVNLSLCHALREEGYESAVLMLEKRNMASLGHCYKIGYRITERVTYLRILGWRMSRRVPVQEPLGVEAVEGVQ